MSTSKLASFVLTLLSVFAAADLTAQPELTEADFLSIGDRATMERSFGEIDVSALTAPGPTGDWDFTVSFLPPPPPDFPFPELLGPQVLEVECLAVDAGPVDAAKTFPGADRVVKSVELFPDFPPDFPDPPPPPPESAEWNYYSCDPGGRTRHGSAYTDDANPDFLLVTVNSPPVVDYPLPLDLGAEWTEEWVTGTDIINDVQLTATVDARGTATLPGIGTVNCVRVHRVGRTIVSDGSVDPPAVLGAFPFRVFVWLAEDYGIVAEVSIATDIHPVDAVPEPGFSIADKVEVMVDFTPAPVEFVRGDVNGSGSYNVADAIGVIFHVVRDIPLSCESAADLDDDGTIAIADALYSLRYLFRRGPAPAAPFPSCGPDPTTDLPCESFAACP